MNEQVGACCSCNPILSQRTTAQAELLETLGVLCTRAGELAGEGQLSSRSPQRQPTTNQEHAFPTGCMQPPTSHHAAKNQQQIMHRVTALVALLATQEITPCVVSCVRIRVYTNLPQRNGEDGRSARPEPRMWSRKTSRCATTVHPANSQQRKDAC